MPPENRQLLPNALKKLNFMLDCVPLQTNNNTEHQTN